MSELKRNFLIIVFLVVVISGSVFSQSIEELENNNGFRNIKFGSNIEHYKNLYDGSVYSKSENEEYFEFPIGYQHDYLIWNHSYFKPIGDARIYAIFLKCYNNLIYEIHVMTDNKREVYELAILKYGKPNGKDRIDYKNWYNKEVGLTIMKSNHSYLEMEDDTSIYLTFMRQDLREKRNAQKAELKKQMAKEAF